MKNETKLLRSRTTLGVKDVNAAIAFYRDAVGFEVQTTMGNPPQFAVLVRDDVSLGLVATTQPAVASFACCYVNVRGVEALHARSVGAGATVTSPLTRQPWGNYDFVICDVDGHQVAFGEAHADDH